MSVSRVGKTGLDRFSPPSAGTGASLNCRASACSTSSRDRSGRFTTSATDFSRASRRLGMGPGAQAAPARRTTERTGQVLRRTLRIETAPVSQRSTLSGARAPVGRQGVAASVRRAGIPEGAKLNLADQFGDLILRHTQLLFQ